LNKRGLSRINPITHPVIHSANSMPEPPACFGFHKTWTKQLSSEQSHNFYSDDTQLTHAAIREGLEVSILPCFMGDSDPELERYSDPDPAHNLGLWVLLHPDLKRTARVLAFRDHMQQAINEKKDLFEGLCIKS